MISYGVPGIPLTSSLGVIYHMPSTFSDQFPAHRPHGFSVPTVTYTADSIPNAAPAVRGSEGQRGRGRRGAQTERAISATGGQAIAGKRVI